MALSGPDTQWRTAAETLPRAEEWSRPIDSREPRITDYVDRAVALCLDYWNGIRSRPAYERAPDDLLDAMASRSLPRHPANVDDWAAELRDEITAHSMGVGHPRWWGFMHSSAHPAGVASELIAATLNDNCWGPGQLATDLELLVMEWIEAGALLVREPGRLEAAFASPAGYLDFTEAPYIAARVRFADRGFELTRSFRALKVWSVLRVEGLEGLRRLWRNDLAVAQRIRSRIEAEPRLESLAPTDLNVFCFRYRCDDPDGCGFQRRLVGEIARDGRSFVGPVSIDGRAGLRGCVCNYRSTLRDADLFIDAVLEIAGRLDAGHALHPVGVR